MPYIVCPGCDEEFYVPRKLKLGDNLTCRSCDAELEVVSVDPVEVDWALEEDDSDDADDWDDDDE